MDSVTSWNLPKSGKGYLALDGSVEADVVIIGGGLTGILSAYEMLQQGKSVILIEKNEIGSGATRFTTAFLTGIIDTDYLKLVETLGMERAKLIADSHRKAIDYIESIVSRENIEYEFKRCSNYIYSDDEKEIEDLKKECKILVKLGFDASLHTENNLGFETACYIEVKNQAKFHPLKFIQIMADIIAKRGGRIFENTEVLKIEDNLVVTKEGKVRGDWILVATYSPFDKPLGLFFKKAMYVSYVLEIEANTTGIREGTFSDTENPYHYFRVDSHKDGARLIVGGEDHRADIKMDPSKKFADLEVYVAKLLKGADYKITRRWSGPILESIDGLAYIGVYNKPNVIYAMAFSGNGMTYSGITALITKDVIMGKPNDWLKIYKPGRSPNLRLLMAKGRHYMEELWNGVIRDTK